MKATDRGSGVTVEREDTMTLELRGSAVVRLDYYNDRARAPPSRQAQGAMIVAE